MNKINYLCLFVFAVIVTASCTKENLQSELSSSKQSSATQTHFIGEHFGGGVIFYLDASGKHGIIATAKDFEEPGFWSKKDTLNGAQAAKLGAGRNNSNNIYKAQGEPQTEADDYAVIECIKLIENGYDDWYLPSKNELNQMYLRKDVIGGFTTFSYWSSTEVDATKAWFQNFGTGKQIKEVKTAGYAIRPVRYF